MEELRDRVVREVSKVVVGQEHVVEQLLVALLVGGHVLLEGAPGVAKTLTANATARAIGLPFRRLQFTPDMLPSDVTGTMTLRGGELVFRPGPVFTSVLLADEINRTPPKTQSALLEAMQEQQVTIDGEPRPLPDPFLVVATQNPIEYEGTYPLPEAQLDRFLMKVDVGYPDEETERAMLRLRHRGVAPATLDDVQPTVSVEEVRQARYEIDSTGVGDEVVAYVTSVVRETRNLPAVELGASPRAAVHLLAAARAQARLDDRGYVTPDDVVAVAHSVLRHRLVLHAEAELERYRPDDAVDAVLQAVPVPAVSPTPRAALALGALAPAALVLPVWLVALAALAVAGATAADALVVRRRIDVERRVPSILSRGVAAPLAVLPGPAPGRVRVRQAAPPDLRIERQEADGPLETTVVARRRGRHTLPAPAARVTGPLGLGRWFQRPGEDATVLVYPDLPEARRLATAVRRGRFRLEGRARGPLGLGTEFESVREYLPDDDVRQVNWRATQRLGRPMSNQYRVEHDRDVICLVDCGRLMAAPLGDRTRLDAAVDATVAVAAVADVLSDRCGAIAFDAAVRREVPPRRGGARRVVQALFDVEPVPVDSDYEAAFAAVGDAKRAWVLVLTDLLEETAALPLLDAVPMLARRHAVAVATVADVDLERLTTEPPTRVVDVYRAAVALDVAAARARVASRLRRAGVDVIEAPPERLAAACVRSYLRAKARARV